MVDPNRKINNHLTDENIGYLNECEYEFKDRFTKYDEEFMAVCNQPLTEPPIVTPWMTDRCKFGSNNHRRNRSGNYSQRSYHRTSNHSNRRNNRNEDRENYKEFNHRSPNNCNGERENDKEFNRSNRASIRIEKRENDNEFNRSLNNRNDEGENEKEFMASNHRDEPKSDLPIVSPWMTQCPSKSGSNNNYRRNRNGNYSQRPYRSRSNQSNCPNNCYVDRENDKKFNRSPNNRIEKRENDNEFNRSPNNHNDKGENEKEFMALNRSEQSKSNPPIGVPRVTHRPGNDGSINYQRNRHGNYNQQRTCHNRSHRGFRQDNRNYHNNEGRRHGSKRPHNGGNNNSGRNNDSGKH